MLEDWSIMLALISTGASLAYTFGAVRQRIAELERRLDYNEKEAEERLVLLQDIRGRVIAIDEWRKHLVNTK